jgi:hypothetical protein
MKSRKSMSPAKIKKMIERTPENCKAGRQNNMAKKIKIRFTIPVAAVFRVVIDCMSTR